MRIASISSSFEVSLSNSVPLSAWNRTTSSTGIAVLPSQALFAVYITEDSFWGVFFTPPTSSVTLTLPANCAYCLFTKPSGFTGASLCMALVSPVFSDPVLVINGIENIPSTSNPSTFFTYYKYDIRPYFDQ